MKTKEQRESEFRADLEKLLEKHGAELDVTDDGKHYCRHSPICEISMHSIYDDNSNITHEYTEFNL